MGQARVKVAGAVCLKTSYVDTLTKASEGESCNGRWDVVTNDEQSSRGHSVVKVSVDGVPIFVCQKCGGCHARNEGGKLSVECTDPTDWGKRVIIRVFEQRVHPQTMKPLDDLAGCEPSSVPTQREATVRKLAKSNAKVSKQWKSKVLPDAFTGQAAPAPLASGFEEDFDEPQEEEWASEPDDPWAEDELVPPLPPPCPDLGEAHAHSTRSVVASSVGPPSGAGSSQDVLSPSADALECTVLEPASRGGFVEFSVEERTFTKAPETAKLKAAALLERVRAKKLGSHAA